jgi:sirohydrochlorin ferrochelatase
MQTLIIMAHGSRSQAANKEFRTYVRELKSLLSGLYDIIEHAFLDEIASPSLPMVAKKMVAAGATGIDIYPFFLNKGIHARRDIPKLVSAVKVEYPGCRFKVLEYFGRSEEIASLTMRHIISQRTEH